MILHRTIQWPFDINGLISPYYTTTKTLIYDAHSKMVLQKRLRIGSGANFVIWGIKNVFYIAHSKTITNNRLRM